MAEANFFYLDPTPSADSGVGGQPTTSQPSSSVQQTSNVTTRNDGSNLASRVESLENLTSDIRENWAKKGQDANFNNLDVKDRLTANFGKIGGFDVSSGVLSTNKLIIDSNNENIRSGNYTPGVSGFKISSDLVEAENILARGALKGVTFNVNDVSVVGGELMVANGGNLEIGMTSADDSTMTLKSGNSFAVSDILLIQQATDSGVTSEWLTVTAKSGNVYTVTRDLAGSFTANNNPAWQAGTSVVKQGDTSSPNYGGWLRLIGEGTNAPYYSVFQRLSGTYNDYQEVCRLGNLNGFLDYTTDSYGIGIGDASGYLKYDVTNGFRLAGSLNQLTFIEAGETLTAGNACQLDWINTAGELIPSDDSYTVNLGGFRDTNFGSANNIAVGSTSYGYIKFNLSGLPTAGLLSANLYTFNVTTGGPSVSLELCNASWSEGSITWNNQPTATTNIGSFTSAYNTYTSVDITSTVSSWLSGASNNYGIRLSNGGSDANISSSENATASQRPYLLLVYGNGKVYKCDARNATNVGRFIGFCFTNTTAGNQAPIEISGQTSTQTGMTASSPYYLSDTRGSISTTPGTVSKKIGLALSSTKLLILNS